MAVGASGLGCWWSPAVHVAWYWIDVGVGVHGKPGAYIVVTLGSLIRENFIDSAGWMGLERGGQMPELARVGGTLSMQTSPPLSRNSVTPPTAEDQQESQLSPQALTGWTKAPS